MILVLPTRVVVEMILWSILWRILQCIAYHLGEEKRIIIIEALYMNSKA